VASTRKKIKSNQKIKSSLYSINTLSGVTSERCPSPQLCAKAHTIKVATVASRWQRVGDLIDSGCEPHTSRTRGERLTTCAVWPVTQKDLYYKFTYEKISQRLNTLVGFWKL